MCNVEDLFYKPDGKPAIEGYLGDEAKEDCKILFVLREPNSGGYDKPSKVFWMRDVVKGEDMPRSSRYWHVLGTLASKLIGPCICNTKNKCEYLEPLKHCAFINLYPCSGSGSKGDKFNLTLEALRNIAHSEEPPRSLQEYKTLAQNRYDIISRISARYIVTTPEIFNALVGEKTNDGSEHADGFKLDDNHIFKKAVISKKMMLSYYHPCYPAVSYDALSKITCE